MCIHICKSIHTYVTTDISINVGMCINKSISFHININMMICIRRYICISIIGLHIRISSSMNKQMKISSGITVTKNIRVRSMCNQFNISTSFNICINFQTWIKITVNTNIYSRRDINLSIRNNLVLVLILLCV